MNPISPYFWSLYATHQVYKDNQRLRKILLPFLIPVIINAVLAVVTPFTDIMFYLDHNNVYHRGPWFPLLAIINYSYFVYTFFIVFNNRKQIERQYYLPLVVFVLPPIFGGILQACFYGLSLIWTSLTLSLLIIYLYVQNNKLNTDYLTGLYNRLQLDRYLEAKIRNSSEENIFSGILIDINDFKKINDQYGHIVGDEALEQTADLLKNSLRKDDFLARYGGDEFIAILDIKDIANLERSVERIRSNFDQFNLQTDKPYKLNLSMGYDVYDHRSAMSLEGFLSHIDNLMYLNKKMKQSDLIQPTGI